MTQRQFWLEIFRKNDVALACAIILINRFTTDEQIENGKEYINQIISQLNDEVPQEMVDTLRSNEECFLKI